MYLCDTPTSLAAALLVPLVVLSGCGSPGSGRAGHPENQNAIPCQAGSGGAASPVVGADGDLNVPAHIKSTQGAEIDQSNRAEPAAENMKTGIDATPDVNGPEGDAIPKDWNAVARSLRAGASRQVVTHALPPFIKSHHFNGQDIYEPTMELPSGGGTWVSYYVDNDTWVEIMFAAEDTMATIAVVHE